MRNKDELEMSINIIRDEIKNIYNEENVLVNRIQDNNKELELINKRIDIIKKKVNKIKILSVTKEISFTILALIPIIILLLRSIFTINIAVFSFIGCIAFELVALVTALVSSLKLINNGLDNNNKIKSQIKRLNDEINKLKNKITEYNKDIAYDNFALEDTRKMLEGKKIAESNLIDEIYKTNLVENYNVNNKTLIKKR